VTLVPSVGKGKGKGKGEGKSGKGKSGKGTGNVADAFVASVTCDDTGAVYSIGEDGNGAMTAVKRLTEDYGLELDPIDNMSPKERALLEARFAAPGDALSANELRGKVSDHLRDHGDRFPVENHGDHAHCDLQVKVEIGVLVLYTRPTPNAAMQARRADARAPPPLNPRSSAVSTSPSPRPTLRIPYRVSTLI